MRLQYGWVVVAAGAVMGCVAIGSLFSLAVFLQPMSVATGWSRTGISTAMTIGFQWLDKHVQKRIERQGHSRALIDTTRILTNPPQSVANLLRFRAPWFRDNRE